MPFLVSAVGAAVCDLLIVCLRVQSGSPSSFLEVNDDNPHSFNLTNPESLDSMGTRPDRLVYHTDYLMTLAVLRFLLLSPLTYHSYTGTAVKCPLFYQLFYGLSLLAVLGHMLTLSMVDPDSLNLTTRLSSPTTTIWLLLLLSLTSQLCHIALYWHVRSTAPYPHHNQFRRRILYYHANTTSSPMDDFVMDVKSRLQTLKTQWSKRLNDYRQRLSNRSKPNSNFNSPAIFRVLLQLFAYEEVLSNGKLDAVFGTPEFTFYVPQLLSFLLHGALESSGSLEDWILEKCGQDIHFAHRCFWFLRAWCLESITSATTASMSRSASHSKMPSGTTLPTILASPSSGNAMNGSLTLSPSLLSTSNDDGDDGSFFSQHSNKFLPEERAVMEELLLKVVNCGERPAHLLQFGTPLEYEPQQHLLRRMSSTDSIPTTSPSALMAAAEAGAIPIHPVTGLISVRHWESVSAPNAYGFLPDSNAAPKDESWFQATPRFLDSLIHLAETLFGVPRESRKQELAKQLKLLEVQVLPCNAIYVPVNHVYHRVWRIAVDECIAISTKERVPCIVCLEVVDYDPYKITAEGPHSNGPNPTANLNGPSSGGGGGMDGIPTLPFLSNNDLSEQEIVNQWRYGPRDPHRRDTILNKVTHSMRDSIGKIRMRERISRLRDHGMLNLHEHDMDFDSAEVKKVDGDLMSLENGHSNYYEVPKETDLNLLTPLGSSPLATDAFSLNPPLTPMTPKATKGELPAMGQWSSPVSRQTSTDYPEAREEPNDNIAGEMLGGIRERMVIRGDVAREAAYGTTPSNTNSTTSSPIKNREKPPRQKAKPPAVVFKENWHAKQERVRARSAYGNHPNWRLLPLIVKANDDLRQEQLASQLIYRIAAILARERVPVWLCPYEIVALTESGGIIEAIPDTISIDSLKKNDPNFTNLNDFFHMFFDDAVDLADAKANFVESLAAYSMVCYLLQIKDRHNGNILLDNRGHLIHIDFGFFFLSSPGKNTGFESAPFKLTRDFVEVMGGCDSRLFHTFRELCARSFIALRRHCMEIILLVEMLKTGNEDLQCFRGRPDDAILGLRERFRLDLNDRACYDYVNMLVDESLENWRTNWYDRYQRYCVGVL